MKNQIFQIRTDKGYVITEYSDGSWACSCPAWKFHRGERVNCKHINEVLEQRKSWRKPEVTAVVQCLNSQDSNEHGLERIPERQAETLSCENTNEVIK
jgi:hypothetical protein